MFFFVFCSKLSTCTLHSILVKEQCLLNTGLLAHCTQYSEIWNLTNEFSIWCITPIAHNTLRYLKYPEVPQTQVCWLIAHNTLRYDGRADYKRIAPRGNGSEERSTAAINSKTGSGQQSTAKQVKQSKEKNRQNRWNGQKRGKQVTRVD